MEVLAIVLIAMAARVPCRGLYYAQPRPLQSHSEVRQSITSGVAFEVQMIRENYWLSFLLVHVKAKFKKDECFRDPSIWFQQFQQTIKFLLIPTIGICLHGQKIYWIVICDQCESSDKSNPFRPS